jgi:hypothetical protein
MRIVLAMLAALALSAGDSKPLAKKELPAPVLAAFQKAYPLARLKACSRETKEGKTCYELESQDGKIGRDLIYAADGSLLEAEEGIDISALPEHVKRVIADTYPKAVVRKAEKLIKGNEVSYEVVVKNGRKEMELTIDGQSRLKVKD